MKLPKTNELETTFFSVLEMQQLMISDQLMVSQYEKKLEIKLLPLQKKLARIPVIIISFSTEEMPTTEHSFEWK